MSRPSTPESFEDQFLAAVKKGEVSNVNDILDRRAELDLNVNCKDASGQSALNIAIMGGNLVVIYPLLEINVHIGDALLRAVDSDFVEAVRLLCEYAKDRPSKREKMDIIDCHCENDDFHPDVTPIVLAAQRNSFAMIKMLVEVGARIPELTADTFQTAATDSLQQSVGGLELYKGLASDAYVVLSSDDPINRCFTLCSNLRKLSEIEVEFKMSYLELIDKMEHCSQELIGQARSTEEILTILTAEVPVADTTNNRKKNTSEAKTKSTSPLPTISRAIELEQRKFVASPNCQQAIISQFYRRLIYLRDKHVSYRILYFFVMLVLHPILALLYLYVPKKRIRDFVTVPYIKFILYVSSDLLLVACLTMEAVLDKNEAYLPTLHEPYKIVICIWILGLALFEFNVMRGRNAKKLIIQWNHIRDICIVICFLYAVVFDAIALAMITRENVDDSTEPVSRSTRDVSLLDNTASDRMSPSMREGIPLDAPYALTFNLSDDGAWNEDDIALNISMYPVYINTYSARRVVGGRGRGQQRIGTGHGANNQTIDEGGVLERVWSHPQLISRALFALATVVSISRIFPYLVVNEVVGPLKISLGSMVQKTSHFFLVVGLVLLSFAVGLTYIYSYYNKARFLDCQANPEKYPDEQICREGDFKDLVTSLITLYWSTFGLNPMDVLKLPQNAKMLETAGLLMYAIFYVFVVVVLLNALIAFMSQVYTEVEENADEEWKFSCTEMWMGFMEDANPLPPPYNLLPSYEDMVSMCGKLIKKYRWKSDRDKMMSSSKQSERELTKTFLRENKKKFDEENKQRRYKKIVELLVDRYVTDKTSGESSTTAEVTAADVRGLKNDLIALRYETFLKMCKTHDYLVHVAGDCLGIHTQSRGTNNIFHKTDVIEDIIQEHAKSVNDFHTTLMEAVSLLPPPPTPPPEPDPEGSSKIMHLIKYYDKAGTIPPTIISKSGGSSPSRPSSFHVTRTLTSEFKMEGSSELDPTLLASRLDSIPVRPFMMPRSSVSMDNISRKTRSEDLIDTGNLRIHISPAEESSPSAESETVMEKTLETSFDGSVEFSDQTPAPIQSTTPGAAEDEDDVEDSS